MMGLEYSIVGDTITMRMDYMDKLMEKVSSFAAERAVEKYQEEKMKDEKLTSKGAAKKIGVSKATIHRYINSGKRVGGHIVKLHATKTGRDFIISRFDLEEFKSKIDA